jgi:hypothetical protein
MKHRCSVNTGAPLFPEIRTLYSLQTRTFDAFNHMRPCACRRRSGRTFSGHFVHGMFQGYIVTSGTTKIFAT